jgi:hypothetical protein
MRIIDLLNKIANGEEVPKKIEYRNIKFLYDETNKLYIDENYNVYNDLLMELSNHKGTDLNYEVEIPEEENKIEKIDKLDLDYKSNIYSDEYTFRKEIMFYCDNLQSKINNLIDEINKLKEDK